MADPSQIVFATSLIPIITTITSSLAAVFSGITAFLSYKLSSKILDELKSDEKLVVGNAIHPQNILHSDHKNCVIVCTLFNKSKRKTFVNKVKVFDSNNKLIEVTWSRQVDSLGNPLLPCQLIGVVDTEELYIRRNSGKWFDHGDSIHVYHSFSTNPETIIFKE